MPWTIYYRITRGSAEIQTSIRAKDPVEAWFVWGDWRKKHKIGDFYAVHAQEVDEDGRPLKQRTFKTSEESRPTAPVMTHLYAVPDSTPRSSVMTDTAFPGLKAMEIWPPSTAVPPPAPTLTAPTLPAPTSIADTVDPHRWPATAAFDRGDLHALAMWSYRAMTGYAVKTRPEPGVFLRGTLEELTGVWRMLGASVHPEARELNLHSCYIKGRWAGMIRLDPLHPGTYITTTPEDRDLT